MLSRTHARRVWAAASVAGLALGVQSSGAGVLYWDINGANPGGADDVTAGGSWDTTTANWSTSADGTAATSVWVSGETAAFSAGTNVTGVATTVTVVGTQTIGGLDFQEGQVNLSGGTALALNGAPVINSTSTLTATIFSPVTGSVRWTKTGTGMVDMRGSKTYTGGLTLTEGTLRINADLGLGAAPASAAAGAGYLVFDGGILQHNNGGGATSVTLNSNRGITIEDGGGTFDATGAGSWIYGGGGLAGSGTLTKTGPNLLVFTGNNSGFSGKYVVAGGTIQSNNSATGAGFGATPATFVSDYFTLDGGGLRVGPTSYTIEPTRGITLGAGGGTLDTANAGSSITINSVISGTGSLTKIDADGVATLAGVNTYTGDTIITAGQLTLADDAGLKFLIGAAGVNNKITGPAAGVVILDGDLTFDLSAAGTNDGDAWTIVEMSNKTYGGTFSVVGFTESADVWTMSVSPSLSYQFTEATGVLQALAIPEPGSLAALALGGMLLARRSRRRGA